MTDAEDALILVIDDEPAILDLTRDLLVEEGFRVITAGDHQRALDILATTTFGLILSDTGGAAADDARWDEPTRIKAAAGDTPVLIFSAHHPSAFEGHEERGFAGIIAKPFDLEALLVTVRALLR